MQNNFQLDDYILSEELEINTPMQINGFFLKGPIPWDWLCKAANIRGRVLDCAIVLCFLSGLTKSRSFKLQGKFFKQFGICNDSRRRSLIKLEEEKLIKVERLPKQFPIVTILY